MAQGSIGMAVELADGRKLDHRQLNEKKRTGGSLKNIKCNTVKNLMF